jgi:hypothetical protein
LILMLEVKRQASSLLEGSGSLVIVICQHLF